MDDSSLVTESSNESDGLASCVADIKSHTFLEPDFAWSLPHIESCLIYVDHLMLVLHDREGKVAAELLLALKD